MIIARAEQLGGLLQDRSADFVLCHSDIHINNLLIGSHGKLFVVDWDQPMLSLKERDLIFVTVGGFVTDEREEALFFQGYGSTEIDPVALTFYRYSRAIEDIGSFGDTVFFQNVAEETKHGEVLWFMKQFEPNGIIQAAHDLYYVLNV